jgi:hypothetical protein
MNRWQDERKCCQGRPLFGGHRELGGEGRAVSKKQTAFFVNDKDGPGVVGIAGENRGRKNQRWPSAGGVPRRRPLWAISFLPQKDVRKAAKALGVS